MTADGLQRGFAIDYRLDFILPSQQAADVVAHVSIVVGDEDAPAFGGGTFDRRSLDQLVGDLYLRRGLLAGQPSHRLFDESLGSDGGARGRTGAADAVGRKMLLADRNRYREARACARF